MLAIFVVVLTLDVIFQDGALLQEVLKTNLYIPFFIKVLVLVLVAGLIFLLSHSVIWEYIIKGPPEIIKTPLQLDRERIAKEIADAEQEIINKEIEDIKLREEEKERIEKEELEAKKLAETEEPKQKKMERKDPTVVDYGQRKSKIIEAGGDAEKPKQQWGIRGNIKKPADGEEGEGTDETQKQSWGVRGK